LCETSGFFFDLHLVPLLSTSTTPSPRSDPLSPSEKYSVLDTFPLPFRPASRCDGFCFCEKCGFLRVKRQPVLRSSCARAPDPFFLCLEQTPSFPAHCSARSPFPWTTLGVFDRSSPTPEAPLVSCFIFLRGPKTRQGAFTPPLPSVLESV